MEKNFTDIAMRLSNWIDEQDVSEKPTVVMAFDDYDSMSRAWHALQKEFADQLFFGYSEWRLKEINNFIIAGVKVQFRLKLKEHA